MKLLEDGQTYTFRSFFEMPFETEEILAEFGVGFESKRLTLKRTAVDVSVTNKLKAELEERLDIVRLSSEMARREVLVSPVLFKAGKLSDSQIRIEYTLAVDNQLKGKLDYLVRGQQNLLIVEAKNDDMVRGFTQLSVEMIALSRKDATQSHVYGAVTIGNVWQFGIFDIAAQQITQDISIYRVPEDLDDVMAILVGILAR